MTRATTSEATRGTVSSATYGGAEASRWPGACGGARAPSAPMRPGGRQNTTLAVVLVTAAACALPAFGKPPAPGPFVPPPEGTLSVCNTSGVRPVTGPFTYTLSALASAGGTPVPTIPVGTCAPPAFYPQGPAAPGAPTRAAA